MDRIAKSPPESLFELATDQWTKPFWDAAAQRRLSIPRCGNCETFRFPPTPFCPHCSSQAIDWVDVEPSGTLYSYTIVTRALVPEMEASIPYVPAVVELPQAGGVRLITNIIGVDVADLSVGRALAVVWHERSDGVCVPRFTFAA